MQQQLPSIFFHHLKLGNSSRHKPLEGLEFSKGVPIWGTKSRKYFFKKKSYWKLASRPSPPADYSRWHILKTLNKFQTWKSKHNSKNKFRCASLASNSLLVLKATLLLFLCLQNDGSTYPSYLYGVQKKKNFEEVLKLWPSANLKVPMATRPR